MKKSPQECLKKLDKLLGKPFVKFLEMFIEYLGKLLEKVYLEQSVDEFVKQVGGNR